MKPTYEIIVNDSNKETIKKTNSDGSIWWIPNDPANSDYQEYLRTLEA
jgi:hypothetical protein